MTVRDLIPALKNLGVLLTGLFLLVALYWTGLHGAFYFDDEANILLVDGLKLDRFSLESIRQVFNSGIASPLGRPVSQFSFALNYFFSGFNPFAFKLTNLAIHAMNGILVFLVAQQLIQSTSSKLIRNDASLLAGFVAVAWLIHPIQLTSVLYVVQRMTSLAAFFLLAALLLHMHGRERGGRVGVIALLVGWAVLWPLSVFSKESGVLFPLFALAWELIVRRNSVGHLDRFARIFAMMTGLVLLAVAVYFLLPRGQWLWAGYEIRSFTLTERLLTEGRVLWFYLGLVLFPQLETLGLHQDDIAISTTLFTPWTTLPALAGLVGVFWLAWRLRARASLVAFGILWFLIGHVLESTVLPLEIAHEHRNYLPLLGFLLTAAWALGNALQRKGAYKTIGVALASAALVYFSLVTALRAHQFGDSVRLAQMEVAHHQGSSRAQYEAGRSLAAMPESALPNLPIHSFARKFFEESARLDPNSKLGLMGLINLNCISGKSTQTKVIEELAHRLGSGPFAPGDAGVLYSLKEMSIAGTICLTRPEIDSLFAAALANPGVLPGVQATLHSWHADYLWLQAKDLPAAGQALRHSLALNPGNPSNRLKWAQLLFIAGEREPARQLLLDLREQNFSAAERQTLNELLAADNMGKP